MTVLDVRGAGIRDWKLTDDKLDVLLNFAAEGAYVLTVELERAVPDDTKDLAAPIVVPVGAERTKGYLGIESRGNLEIAATEVTEATAIDVRTLPGAILGITDQPLLLGYKYLGNRPKVGLATGSHAEVDVLVTLLDQTQARTMWTREGRRLTSVTYQVRNNRRQFLRIELPKGAELWSAAVGGKGVQPAKAKDGRVMVPLLRSQEQGGVLSSFVVEVVYIESGKAVDSSGRGRFEAKLPVPDVPSTYVAWTVYSPEGAKVGRFSHDGSLRHVKHLSNPIPSVPAQVIQTPTDGNIAQDEMQAYKSPQGAANAATTPATGGAAMGQGAAPVMVNLPLTGVATHYEKLLALGEPLEVTFKVRGLRK
jgi:hypothetical protein